MLCHCISTFFANPFIHLVCIHLHLLWSKVPKVAFIFYTILRFSSNRYQRAFHFIPPNLNRKNNMDKAFYPIYYIWLFQILFYIQSSSHFHSGIYFILFLSICSSSFVIIISSAFLYFSLNFNSPSLSLLDMSSA